MNPERKRKFEDVKHIGGSVGVIVALLSGIYFLATSTRFTSKQFETPGLTKKQLEQMRGHNVTHYMHKDDSNMERNSDYRQYMINIFNKQTENLPDELAHKHS